jgi:hypothetical protein
MTTPKNKVATSGSEAMRLYEAGWRQVSDYSCGHTVMAVPIEEWRAETRAKIAEIDADAWVVFAPPA